VKFFENLKICGILTRYGNLNQWGHFLVTTCKLERFWEKHLGESIWFALHLQICFTLGLLFNPPTMKNLATRLSSGICTTKRVMEYRNLILCYLNTTHKYGSRSFVNICYSIVCYLWSSIQYLQTQCKPNRFPQVTSTQVFSLSAVVQETWEYISTISKTSTSI